MNPTPFREISLGTWANQSERRLAGSELRQGEDYTMLSQIGGSLDYEAGITYVRLSRILRVQSRYAIIASFLTEDGELASTNVEGDVDTNNFFSPYSIHTGATIHSAELGRNIGYISTSFFLAPTGVPVRRLDEPESLEEQRTPDRTTIVL